MLFVLIHHYLQNNSDPIETVKIKPVVYKGSYAICSNNHMVTYINRDIYRGDVHYSTAFEYLEHQPIPVKGQTTNPVCYCGEPWFSLDTRNLINKPVTSLRLDNEKNKTECI